MSQETNQQREDRLAEARSRYQTSIANVFTIARRTYSNIKDRCKCGKGSYASVQLKMSKEQFLNWAVPEYTKWILQNPGKKPSIDRINSDGHYELGNVQIIEVQENRRKSKRFVNDNAPEGTKWCPKCKKFVSVEFFSRGKPNAHQPDGLGLGCRPCISKSNREYGLRRIAEGRPIIDKRRKKM